MDSDPFTFWSNFFSDATRRQKRIADAWGVASEGFSTLQDINLFWQRMWDMEKGRSGGLHSLNKLPDLFPFLSGASFASGVVPMREYLSLVRKYEEMKEKVAAGEETIQHLKLLLESKGCERKEQQTGYQDPMKRQADAFFSLMRGMQLLP